MQIGLQIPQFDWPGGPASIGASLAAIARMADDAGFASIWVMDHFFQMEMGDPKRAEEPMLESYTALAFIAASTHHARIGAMVTGANYRPPGLLVKEVTTVDVLSGGRAWFGVGAGWYEREALGLGMPFPPLKERFERLKETLQIAHQMWSGDRSPYVGKHNHLAEPMLVPQPLSKPHPPILIGGLGEKKTLRLVAQYADACNFFSAIGTDALKHKLDVLKRHCEDVGRDYNTIERTALVFAGGSTGAMDTGALIADCERLAALGFQHAIFTAVPSVETLAPLELIGSQVIPAVAGF